METRSPLPGRPGDVQSASDRGPRHRAFQAATARRRVHPEPCAAGDREIRPSAQIFARDGILLQSI
jgi:hypothetical protein